MPSASTWILAAREAPTIYWGATGIALGAGIANPWVRKKIAYPMVSFGVRSTVNVTFASARALFATTVVRGGTVTFGGALVRAGGSIAGGYVLGATIGTGIAYAGWGEKGASDALDFYTDPMGVDYWSTVGSGFRSLL